MNRLRLFFVAAIASTMVLASDAAIAGVGYLATGDTFCPAGEVVVFTVVNAGGEDTDFDRIKCNADVSDEQSIGPRTLRPGDRRVVVVGGISGSGGCQVSTVKVNRSPFWDDGTEKQFNGELVRCTVTGEGVAALRGTVHICPVTKLAEPIDLGDCDLTEALFHEE